MGQLRQTAKHSAIYAIGSIISRITALVMLPIYTRYLTPADYGVLELLSMAIDLTGILVGMRISQAMFRYYILSEDEQERRITVSTVLFTALLASTSGAFILYLAAGPISEFVFGSDKYLFEFQLFAFTLISNSASAVGLSFIRARRKPVLFVLVGIGTLALQITFNVVFVVVLEMHVRGVVYSALLSGIIVASLLCLYVLMNSGLHYSRKIAVKVISYISPLILASLGAFYVAYADKYFIRVFSGLADVGLYALAARIGSVLTTVNNAFNMSWNADRFEIVKRDDAKQIFSQVFKYLSALLILIGAGLSIFANDVFKVMTNPEFYAAGSIVPMLMLAYITNIYTMFCNFGIVLKERTRHMAEASWAKAVFATILYIILIPNLGVYGAAFALFCANMIELILVNRNAKKLYDMRLEWNHVGLMMSAATLCVLISLLLPIVNIDYFIVRVFLYLSLVLIIYYLPIWKDSEKEMLKGMIFSVLKLRRNKP